MPAAPPAESAPRGGAPVAAPVTRELTPSEQARMVQALAASLAAPSAEPGGAPPRHIETHISHVLLHGGHAWKFKKAIATSFLDQSTLARRRHACAEELRLNRRLAPELYLDVVEVRGTPGEPWFAGESDAADDRSFVLDVAVRMRAFDEAGLWDRLAARGELGAADVDDLAARLARFHADAAVAPDDAASPLGTPALARQALLASLDDLQALAGAAGWPDAAALAGLDRLRAWEARAWVHAAPAMARRRADGRVRECHGDLHLGNVAREQGHCLVFDGIEFNDTFRWIDVIDEVAFMTMDLLAHGLPALAHRFANAWLEASGDYDGLAVFGYYLVHRALVRAKVAQLRAEQGAKREDSTGGATDDSPDTRAAALDTARRYFALAEQLTAPRPRAFLVTHGVSGSGKTTLTQDLVEAAGAVRVRADVERKRLAGLAPLQSSRSLPGAGLYTAAMNAATQERLLAAAADVVRAGWPVIVDATFIRREARDAARRVAAQLGVPFIVLRFAAPPELLRERVRTRAARGDDASEADEAVLADQLRVLEPIEADESGEVFDVRPAMDWAPLLARLGN